MNVKTELLDASGINLEGLFSDTSGFGPAQILKLRDVVAGGRSAELRLRLGQVDGRIRSGTGGPGDLLASGVSRYLLGEHAAARDLLVQLPDNGTAQFYLGLIYIALELYPDAVRAFEMARKHGHDSIQSQLQKAGAIRLTGQVDAAEELLRSVAREAANRADYSYQMGCILADRGDTFGAIEYLERAVDMDRHHAPAMIRLAGISNRLGNDDEAAKLYERALSRPPFYLGAMINLGLLYEDQERYTAAAYCFRRVLDADPQHARARLYLRDIEASGNMYYDEDAERRQRELGQVMNVPITDFELSARSRNCLERAGIVTLGDLTQVSEEDLLGGKNFGETSLKEIREILASRGLRIGQSVAASKPMAPVLQLDDLTPQERALYEKPVVELGLSVRSRKCVSRLGISTIGELVARSPDELMGVRNFGVTSLNEIRAKLAEVNLKLRND